MHLTGGGGGKTNTKFHCRSFPGPPTILKNQVLSPTSVLLSWMPSDGDSLTRYSVSYTYKGPCGEGVVGGAGVVSTGSIQYTIQGLEEYSTYALSIRAERGGQVTMSNTTVTTWAAGIFFYLCVWWISKAGY